MGDFKNPSHKNFRLEGHSLTHSLTQKAYSRSDRLVWARYEVRNQFLGNGDVDGGKHPVLRWVSSLEVLLALGVDL